MVPYGMVRYCTVRKQNVIENPNNSNVRYRRIRTIVIANANIEQTHLRKMDCFSMVIQIKITSQCGTRTLIPVLYSTNKLSEHIVSLQL